MSSQPLPKLDTSGPGWTILQGQAVWHPPRQTVTAPPHLEVPPPSQPPEIAGDLIVATGPNGSAFVQFSKTPFTVAIAQLSPSGWQLEIPPRNLRFSRPGKAPGRVVWFQLAHALDGKSVAKGWTWSGSADKWHLENLSTGESLEGYLSQ